jgi:mono/diheme cytochrome c family protein
MKKVIITVLFLAFIVFIAYEVLIFYDNEFKYSRMRETPAVRPHEKPLLIMEAGVVPFSGGEMNYRVQKPEDLKSPFKIDDSEAIQRGKDVYFEFCAVCHGKHHDGNGTVGQSLFPLPTDLRSPKVQSKSDGALFKTISYGTPNEQQPALATTVEVSDRWRVIVYMKSLEPRKKVVEPHEEEMEHHEEEMEHHEEEMEHHEEEKDEHAHLPDQKEHKHQ